MRLRAGCIGESWGIAESSSNQMPFKKGERLPGQGGYRKNAGRKSAKEVEILKTAGEVARDYIERSVKPVMATYFQLAHGRYVNKYSEGKLYAVEFEADAATTRHFVDKLLPDGQEDTANATVNILIAAGGGNQSQSDIRANGLQIHFGGSNGKNGNGSDGA